MCQTSSHTRRKHRSIILQDSVLSELPHLSVKELHKLWILYLATTHGIEGFSADRLTTVFQCWLQFVAVWDLMGVPAENYDKNTGKANTQVFWLPMTVPEHRKQVYGRDYPPYTD